MIDAPVSVLCFPVLTHVFSVYVALVTTNVVIFVILLINHGVRESDALVTRG